MWKFLAFLKKTISFIWYFLFVLFGLIGIQMCEEGINVVKTEGTFANMSLNLFNLNTNFIFTISLIVLFIIWIVINLLEKYK